MPLNLFIIGPSGCGKSTQAKLIADKYHLTHLSMGQLLRDEIASKSVLGNYAQSFVDQGIWVPDDAIFDVLINNLTKINFQDFIIDGFPRVLNQAKYIEYFLKNKQQPLTLLIHLDVTFDEIMARRTKKGEEFQDESRTDNTPVAVAKRQTSYDETIVSIKEYFKAKKNLFNVDGNRPVEPIFEDICKKIDKMR